MIDPIDQDDLTFIFAADFDHSAADVFLLSSTHSRRRLRLLSAVALRVDSSRFRWKCGEHLALADLPLCWQLYFRHCFSSFVHVHVLDVFVDGLLAPQQIQLGRLRRRFQRSVFLAIFRGSRNPAGDRLSFEEEKADDFHLLLHRKLHHHQLGDFGL